MALTTNLPGRLSPLHDVLEHLHPTWGELASMPVALNIGQPAVEAERARGLGLCDISAFPRITLKGPGAKTFLDGQGIAMPEAVFGVAAWGQLGLAARTGGAEFFLEQGPGEGLLAQVEKGLTGNPAGVYPVRRADASVLLSGTQALDVLEQTCGYNFRTRESKLVFTRVAGVSCSVLPRVFNSIPVFQLWMDGTYGVSLWEALLEIAGEQGGGSVGLRAFFPNLSSVTP